MILSIRRIAIVGDLHGSWSIGDHELLQALSPDAVLFVGDLGDGDLRIVKSIKKLSIPTAVILGNHDRAKDRTGELLRVQLNLFGDLHCGWTMRKWRNPNVGVVGARPCSSGGGFHLSPEVLGVFGPITLKESVRRIVEAAEEVPPTTPLVILAHVGPTGLGSQVDSICGRDWKPPSMDWGDKDLEIALDQIRKRRIPDLVVFGHMHHELKSGSRNRHTFLKDRWGTVYLNAACVPRKFKELNGDMLTHLSWVEFVDDQLVYVSHRWFKSDYSLAYEKVLLS